MSRIKRTATHSASRSLFLLLLLAGCDSSGEPDAPSATTEPKPPNVLLVTIDTLRADHVGCYGYQRDTTPAIDAFAKTAVVFENVHATSSWTLPSMASIMTSLYTSSHGCWDAATPLDAGFETLAERLRDAGYFTAGFVSQVFVSRRFGMDQGFRQFDDELSKFGRAHEMFSSTGGKLAERAALWLDARASEPDPRPWLLWVHFFDPHMAYVPHRGLSEEFGTEEELDLYDGEIRWTDEHVGTLLDKLTEHGFDEETIVVLAADHGEEFGDHGGKFHRHTLYRELLHVPLILRAPGVEAARVTELASLVDVMPTVLALAGVESPPGSGRDLLAEPNHAAFGVLAELQRENDRLECVISNGTKLIRGGSARELYSLTDDPNELEDLASKLTPADEEQLDRIIEAARRFARGTGTRLDFTQEEIDHLKALGYTDDR